MDVMNEKRGLKFFLFGTILIILLFVVSGQTQCPSQGTTSSSKTGLDFSLDSNPNFLYAGKTLEIGENFNIGVIIENYDSMQRTGKICILDDVSDNFLGITSSGEGQCSFFSVKAAEISEQQSSGFFGGTQKSVTPGKTEVYFPTDGAYKYQGLPNVGSYDGKMIISLYYTQTSKATTTLNIPSQNQPSISQEPAPITLSLTQSSYKVSNAYQTDLKLNLAKQSDAKIFSSDFSKENFIFFSAEVPPQDLICSTRSGEKITNSFEIGNENIIKCSFLSYSENIQSYPLIVTMDYGVKISKGYMFQIKTE